MNYLPVYSVDLALAVQNQFLAHHEKQMDDVSDQRNGLNFVQRVYAPPD